MTSKTDVASASIARVTRPLGSRRLLRSIGGASSNSYFPQVVVLQAYRLVDDLPHRVPITGDPAGRRQGRFRSTLRRQADGGRHCLDNLASRAAPVIGGEGRRLADSSELDTQHRRAVGAAGGLFFEWLRSGWYPLRDPLIREKRVGISRLVNPPVHERTTGPAPHHRRQYLTGVGRHLHHSTPHVALELRRIRLVDGPMKHHEVDMNMRPAITAALLAFSLLPAAAQEPTPKAEEGKKPSEILAFVEARPDFARLDGMSWNDRGYYEIEYRTNDKARVEINIAAKSGQPVDQD